MDTVDVLSVPKELAFSIHVTQEICTYCVLLENAASMRRMSV